MRLGQRGIVVLTIGTALAVVVLVALTGVETWHGWDWRFWSPLVAIGTLALAIATIDLAISTKRLATQTAVEISESHRARRNDAARIGIERIYTEVLHLIEAVERSRVIQLDVAAINIAQSRVAAAVSLAGGPEEWHQTDQLSRDRERLEVASMARQAQAALLEVADAVKALDQA